MNSKILRHVKLDFDSKARVMFYYSELSVSVEVDG